MTEEKNQNKPAGKPQDQKQNQPGEKPQEKKTERSSSNRRRPSNRRRKKPPVLNDDSKKSEQGKAKSNQTAQKAPLKKDPAKDVKNRNQSKSSGERNGRQKDQQDGRPAVKKNPSSSNRGKRRDQHSNDRRDKNKKPTSVFKKAKAPRPGQIRQLIFKKNNNAYFSKTGEKDVRLELMDQVEPHFLYRGNNRRYYVATEYSGILHVIVDFDEYEEAKEALRIRGEHDFSQILEFEVESNLE